MQLYTNGHLVLSGAVMSKNICEGTFDTSMTFTNAWTNYQIPLAGFEYNNAGFTMAYNSIYIPQNVSCVKVSFTLNYYTVDNPGDKNFMLYKNGTLATSLVYTNYSGYYSGANAFAIVYVSPGDALSFWCSSDGAGNMRMFNPQSRFMIEIIA